MSIKGEIEVTLRDKATGDIIRRGVHQNTVTDIWRMRGAILTMMTGNPATVLRGLSKPTTGQYVAALGEGTFGVYAMNAPITLSNDHFVPPYVDESHSGLSSSVEFYNANNDLSVAGRVMLAADPRCVYSYDAATATYTVTYVQNSGAATVASLVFGRSHEVPEAHQGYLIGESTPIGTTGTVNYFLEHKIDRTIVWKTITSSDQFNFDLLSKAKTSYTLGALHTNIGTANLTGGLVIGNMVVKATRLSHSDTEVVVRLTTCINFTTNVAVVTRDIVFNGLDLDTERINHPVLVARPDLPGFEVLVPMAVNSSGCTVAKCTVTDLEGGIAGATTNFDTFTPIPYVIGQSDNTTVQRYCTGYYDVATGLYRLPYTQYVNGDGSLTNVQTSNYQPGLVIDLANGTKTGDWLCRTDTNFNAACMTDKGLLQFRPNTTTTNYFWGSGVISGANFETPYVKLPTNVLELAYKFTFS